MVIKFYRRLDIDESSTYKCYRWMRTGNVLIMRAKPPRPHELIKLIRELVAQGHVQYTHHAEHERMPERGIDFLDVEAVIALGDIDGRIEPGERPGEWRCLVVGKPDLDSREMGVATVVLRRKAVLIVTVEWIDP